MIIIKQLIVIKRHLQGIVKAIENLIANDKTKEIEHDNSKKTEQR